MKNIFIVGAKLLAIYLLVISIYGAINGIVFSTPYTNLYQAIFSSLSSLIIIILSLLLLFNTDTIATLINVPDTKTPILEVNPEELYGLGISLIGLNIFIWHIGFVIGEFDYSLLKNSASADSANLFWSSLIMPVLGVVLVIFANKIATFVFKIQNYTNSPIIKPYPFDDN